MSDFFDPILWWLALELIGLCTMPIALYIGENLKDRGYSMSKPLGLLLLTYIVWMFSLLGLDYSVFLVIFSLTLIAVISFILFLRKSCIKDFLYAEKSYILKFEVLFFIAFLIFTLVRGYSPDINWTGGEKFMDMSFINAFLRSSHIPPADPWMSGEAIQYYYFGYLIVANLIKFTGIVPSVAFNLATSGFFALSLTTASGIGYNLSQRWRYGVMTAFFVVIAGNLVGFFQLIDIIIRDNVIKNLLEFNYWTSSRVIPDTINEFPFFSFLQGDVHAHMISITFQLLIILLLLNIFKSRRLDAVSLVVLGLCLGFLYPLNTWDYPSYLFLSIIVIVLHFTSSGISGNDRIKDIILMVISIGVIFAISYLSYLPYHLTYKIDRAILMVPSGRTSLLNYLAIYGLFLFLISRFVIFKSRISRSQYGYILAALISLFMLSALLKFDLLVLLVPLLVLTFLSLRMQKNWDHAFALILIMTGIFISLFCELFYIQDALGMGFPAFIRMNTIFKLYLQNWILWGAAAGYIVFHFRDSFYQKSTWAVMAAILVIMVCVYPFFATIGISRGFSGTPTLDGEEYVAKQHPQDYMAILFFKNMTGEPIVLQAPGETYEWNTYITVFSGLPTVSGWAGHEMMWRPTSGMEINARILDVNRIYTSLNLDEINGLLKKYNVSYIYFGDAERRKYSSPRVFELHPDRFEKVFEYGDAVVYRVST